MNTTTTHTQGPWTYHAGYIRQGETYLAEVLIGPDCPDVDTSLANARLIAVSPDLLRQGTALVHFLVENDTRWSENQFVLDMQAAIAQAQGVQP
jgi:hypothetical protein